MQSLAMLDAVLSPEWEYRYFSFNNRWSPGEQMGSMRNGQGDHYFALFNAAGCWLKGFDHEAPYASDSLKTAGVFDGVPAELNACLVEPAFVVGDTTFCIWRRYIDHQWHRGPVKYLPNEEVPDGSSNLLRYLDGDPKTYRDWATDYYEHDVSLTAIQSIYERKPLDQRLVTSLNAEASLSELNMDIAEIGYPHAEGLPGTG
jgi:hypothetical protein